MGLDYPGRNTTRLISKFAVGQRPATLQPHISEFEDFVLIGSGMACPRPATGRAFRA
jgi:hypothetical protein